jgi:hypothetical protein
MHYGNVLAGRHEPWLVIDPKVIRGPYRRSRALRDRHRLALSHLITANSLTVISEAIAPEITVKLKDCALDTVMDNGYLIDNR